MKTRLGCPPLLLVVFVAVLGSYLPRFAATKLWKQLHFIQPSATAGTECPSAAPPTVAQQFGAAKTAACVKRPRVSKVSLLKEYVVQRRYDVKRDVLGEALTFRVLTAYCSTKHFLNEQLYRAVVPHIRLMPLHEHGRTPLLIERAEVPYLIPPQRPVRLPPGVLVGPALGFFRRLAEQHPDLNVFVYSTRPYENSAIHDSLMPWTSYETGREAIWTEFRRGLPPSVSAAELTCDARSYRDYFYRTDHHWTIRGAWTAYAEITDLIRARVPSIGEPVKPRTDFGLQYRLCGTYAKTAAFRHHGDELRDVEMDLPSYEVHFNGTIKLPRNDRALLLAGQVGTGNPYENYYGIYWGHDYGLLSYRTGAEGRSLLVIADSFSNCMESFFTAHYSTVHVVDPRHYLKDLGEPFVFRTFLQAQPVHEVLFMLPFDQILGLAENSVCGPWETP